MQKSLRLSRSKRSNHIVKPRAGTEWHGLASRHPHRLYFLHEMSLHIAFSHTYLATFVLSKEFWKDNQLEVDVLQGCNVLQGRVQMLSL